MTKREENKYSMYRTVGEILTKYQAVVSANPALDDSVVAFRGSMVKISEIDNHYKSITKGATIAKNIAEDELIELVIQIGSVLYVFAKKNGDENLKSLCKVTESELKQLRDSDLLQKCKNIYENFTSHVDNMTSYGVSQEMGIDYKNKLDTYENALSGKEGRAAESKAIHQELVEQFKITDEILYEEIDKLMEFVGKSNKEFYNQYQAARVINDL